MSNLNSNAAAKATILDRQQHEEPTIFAFYGGFELADNSSKHVVIGASRLLFNNFFPVRVLVADGTSKELALEFLQLVIDDIKRNGVHQAPDNFRDSSETFEDAMRG